MKVKCIHCERDIPLSVEIGTAHRNHCPFCLWSRHVDLEESGDRQSECQGEMQPIGLTFKKEGIDKFGLPRQGELMLVHRCAGCGKVSINRIAGDDNSQAILDLLEESKSISSPEAEKLNEAGIRLLTEKDREEIEAQLFGKKL